MYKSRSQSARWAGSQCGLEVLVGDQQASWGDQLLPEGDDESSAAVKLAVPLRFYDAQFSDLYDTSLPVLDLAARYLRKAFPLSGFTPTHAFLATWEHVGAYEEVRRGAAPSRERNTFQVVLASDGSDTYAIFLYPANGLQFLGTRPKESYNVQLQLPARVGFCRGEVDDLKREVPCFSLTNTEQSVKNLYQ
ncbi:Nidogen-2 [Cricetulus griseus]|uniref:Nidogen-2 n=1 Tax=Cricetulus griseus TaxID=10029 RepID=G3IAE4_CRIGR|nr:Nidogen-2 [Cricetulus griseus]